jgi:dihydromethanopterin reductase (acceptor)
MPNLAWGITGASDKLEATFDQMEKVAAIKDVRVTTFITQAGVEVVKHYSLHKRLAALSNGEPFREIIGPKTHGAATYIACRFFAREYETLLVAPCTSNTLCKFSAGIADTPVTIAADWAIKAGLSIFVLQTYMTMGMKEYPGMVRLDPETCRRCDDCPPERACKYGAITRRHKYPYINLLKCVGSLACVKACPYNAIKTGEKFRLVRRMVDQEAAERVSEIKGMAVLNETRQIEPTLKRYAVEVSGLPPM